MSQSCLIAQTPRAGRWNYRFLVPPGAGYSEAEIANWADQASHSQKGVDYLAAVREDVLQQESGRSGKELVMLVGLSMKRLDKSDLSQIHRNLTKRLDDLEQLVISGVDWEQEGRQTLVVRQELRDWYQQDVVTVFPKLLAGSTRNKPKGSHLWRVLFLIALVVGIGSYLMADELLEKFWSFFKSSRQSEAITNGEKTPDAVPLEGLALWAEAVGVETGSNSKSSVEGKIADKLEENLFLLPKPQDEKRTPTLADDQVRLQKRLNSLKLASESEGIEIEKDLQKLLNTKSLRDKIEELMSKPNRFVFVGKHADSLQELMPKGTPKEVKDFRELLETAHQLSQRLQRQRENLPETFPRILDKGRWVQHQHEFVINESLAHLKVPVQKDADAAVTIVDCLRTPKQPRFDSFTEWYEAMQTEVPEFLTMLDYVKLPDKQNQDVDTSFIQFVQQLRQILDRNHDEKSQTRSKALAF